MSGFSGNWYCSHFIGKNSEVQRLSDLSQKTELVSGKAGDGTQASSTSRAPLVIPHHRGLPDLGRASLPLRPGSSFVCWAWCKEAQKRLVVFTEHTRQATQPILLLLYFREEQKTASALWRANVGTGGGCGGSQSLGHLPAAVPRQGERPWHRVLLPVCGCFPTPPFVQTHPRCHGERRPLVSRVTATTLLGLEPAQPKGR